MARELVLLILATLGAAPVVGAAAASHRSNSLVVADWPADMSASPCDPGPSCINILGTAHLVHARALSGPPVPKELAVRFGMHATPVPGARVVAVIKRQKDGSWQALWLNQTAQGAEDCYSHETFEAFRVAAPPMAHAKGGEICFST